MKNETYDRLKLIALIAVPLFAFIGAMCSIWNIPHSEQITATLTAIDTLLGAIVAILAHEYNKPLPVDISGLQYLEDEEIDAEETEDDEEEM